MKAVVMMTSLASLASTTTTNWPDERMGWIDVCSYSDPTGSTCCPPGMENKEYLVVTEDHDWFGHTQACRLYGGDRGWLAVLDDREEASCLQHYILSVWEPSFQRFAISLRAPFTMPGIYHWLYPNGSQVQPKYTDWAMGHPIDRGCVTMLLGDEAQQGAWLDVDCVGDIG